MLARRLIVALAGLIVVSAAVGAEPAKPDALVAIKTREDLVALIVTTADAATKEALKSNADAILAAAKRKLSVEAVAATLTKASGSFEKINVTPEALKSIVGESRLFDTLKSVNLADANLGIKAKRETDPFDREFYEHLSNVPELESLVIINTVAQNDSLVPLAKLTGLKSLRIINQGKLTDEGLAHLAGLKQLEQFGYIGTAMTGEPFKDFKGWTNLKSSSFRGSKMSDAGLIALCEAFPNLQSLVLAHGHFSDAAVEKVATLKKLTALEIGSPKATPACLKSIQAMPLEYLQLGDGLDAAAGLAIVKDMKTLKRLTLTNCKATTDDDLKSVAGLTGLEQLELGNLDIPESRLAVLKQFGFLKSLRLPRPSAPYPEDVRARVKAVLPNVALKFE